jgi:nitrate/TMAO reductase-like tetraheme cytochrome c subunit
MVRTLMVVTGFVILFGVAARQPSAQTKPNPASMYVGAATCNECHEPVYAAWSKTKHANALDKLSREEREGGLCIKCHVTGTPEMIAAEGGKPSLPGVQCENCHGPGAAHVQAARNGDATDARTAAVTEETCLRCHNKTSPHYKPFFFGAMKPLVHRK